MSLLFAGLCGTATAADPLPPASARPVDFEQDVWPILERSCLSCHGATQQKGGYRLDDAAATLKGGDLYSPAVKPGDSAHSALVLIVAGADPDLKMPQKGDPLSDDEVGILRAWIDQGAKRPEPRAAQRGKSRHWAFQPLSHPEIPAGETHAIDALIDARLAAQAMARNPEADRRTLLRRLYFDLIGLPPAPEELAGFVADADPQAYEVRVDALLKSPRYGERWARHWLDVVRFAESHGFEMNRPRPNAWPYRDWVIRALNDDMPFGRFIKAQLAGDALGDDAATGFLVAGSWDQVRSPDPVLTANQRADELHDLVSVTGAAFLGLTVGCARCHTHKFDPILQTDYYALKAVFAGVQHGERVWGGADGRLRDQQLLEARARLQAIEARLAQFESLAGGGPPRPAVQARRNVERFAPRLARAVRLTIRATEGPEPCLDEIEVLAADDSRNVAAAAAGAKPTSSSALPGYAIHRTEHLNDGLYGNDHSWISHEAAAGWAKIEFAAPVEVDRILWSRDRLGRFHDRLATNYVVELESPDGVWQVVASSDDRDPPGGIVPKDPGPDLARLAADVRTQAERMLPERDRLLAQLPSLESQPQVYAGIFGTPETTHRFVRGDPTQPAEEIAPGGLSEFGGDWRLKMDAPDQERRLALADWIAAPENALTSRVIVNRLWQHHFGRGLVDTPSDFGSNGALPTHPELLDWLAGEFIARGRSLKALHRLIVTSATYRQSSAARPEALAADADARLLWRYPPQRLEAEPLRDTILAVTGKLDLRMGGPGFDLFEPNDNYVKVYQPKSPPGPETWRRMIYQSKPRMQLDDVFGAFDCPDAGQATPRRLSSTTPLQSLGLLNSSFAYQQAQLFAERLEGEADRDASSQVLRAFALALQREPRPRELDEAVKLIEAHGLPAFCRALLNSNEFLMVF